MLIFVQVCRTIDKKISVFKIKHRFWKNKWRAMNFTKRKLVLQERLWTKEVLKIIRSTLIRSTLTRSWRHQKVKITSSLRLKLKFIESCHFIWISMKKEHKLGKSVISEEFEGIGCLSIEERWKRTIVHLYDHYIHYSVLCLQ